MVDRLLWVNRRVRRLEGGRILILLTLRTRYLEGMARQGDIDWSGFDMHFLLTCVPVGSLHDLFRILLALVMVLEQICRNNIFLRLEKDDFSLRTSASSIILVLLI